MDILNNPSSGGGGGGGGITWVSVPATAASSGTAGQIAKDSDYIYICVATDTWKRCVIGDW
jgi:hypothetical protein